MRPRTGVRRLLILLGAASVLVLGAACKSDAGSSGAVLAERLLRLGEQAGTKLEVQQGQLPADLKTVLNPGATKDTPAKDLTSIPVYPGSKLQGSFRLERPDGTVAFFLLYDAPGAPEDVEGSLAKLVNESPWQTVGGQSSDAVAALRFQNTNSSDVSGTVAIQPVQVASGAKPVTSVIYIMEVEPSAPPKNKPYVLPAARPLPNGFPAEFVLDGMTPIQVQWAAVPQGKSYQVRLLTKQSATDVTEQYRDRFQKAGWTLSSDDARGFATALEFTKDNGTSQASISVDAFDEDASYTEAAAQLRIAR
ncbi:MAG: hypothetical protein U0360_02700 [Dehalococcoidia bacterium]